MKRKMHPFLLICILLLAGEFIFFVCSISKTDETVKYTHLTSEQQNALSSELDLIMGGHCEISVIKKTRIGGQAQVNYFFITVKCDSIHTSLPMESGRFGSGYYYEGDNIIVRVLDDDSKEITANLVHCLEGIFNI